MDKINLKIIFNTNNRFVLFRRLFTFCVFAFIILVTFFPKISSFAEDGNLDVHLNGDSEVDIDLIGDRAERAKMIERGKKRNVNFEKSDVISTKEDILSTNSKNSVKNSATEYEDLSSVELNILNKYENNYYDNKDIKVDRSSGKKKIQTKFDVKIVDANNTDSGLALKDLQEAFRCYKQRDYELAVFFYKKSLEKNPKSVEALFGLGVSYQLLRQYDQAIEYYLKLFEMNYSRKKLVSNLLLCLQHKSYKSALETLLSIDQNILGYSDILAQIGVIYMKTNDNAKAISAFTRAYELSPMNAVIAYDLGILYDRSNNIDYAKHFFDIAIRNNISDILNHDDNKRLMERVEEIDAQIIAEVKKNKKNK